MAKWIAGLFLPLVVLVFALGALFYHPETPLSNAWNPTKPLDPTAQPNLLTQWKLNRALSTPANCRAALSLAGARYSTPPDKAVSDICHIRDRTIVKAVSKTTLAPLDTTCEMGLRLAMWTLHSVQPAAQYHFNTGVKRIHHFGSFSCRKIVGSSRMSQHSTANALDVAGFDLANGQRITLRNHWDGDPTKTAFLQDVYQGSCDWFWLVLSPDYNAAHHDHFHFDQGRWGGCK